MAQRQRRPAQEGRQTTDAQQVLERMQQMVDTVRNMRLTPAQIQKMEHFIRNMENILRQQQTMQGTPTQAVPRQVQRQAPQRAAPAQARVAAPVRRYVYDVVLEGKRYQLELDRQLTPGHERQELLRMARNGEFFERLPRKRGESDYDYGRREVMTPGWPRPRVSARRVAGSPTDPEAQTFNSQPESSRTDSMAVRLEEAENQAIPQRPGESREEVARRRDSDSSAVPLTVTFIEEKTPARGG